MKFRWRAPSNPSRGAGVSFVRVVACKITRHDLIESRFNPYIALHRLTSPYQGACKSTLMFGYAERQAYGGTEKGRAGS